MSVAVSQAARRNPDGVVVAYHCCQADTPITLAPAAFVRTVASMLASQHPAYPSSSTTRASQST